MNEFYSKVFTLVEFVHIFVAAEFARARVPERLAGVALRTLRTRCSPPGERWPPEIPGVWAKPQA